MKYLSVVCMAVVLMFSMACDEGDLEEIASKLESPKSDEGWYSRFNGTTWRVENKTGDACYDGFVGQITFGPDGTAFLDDGRVAALGAAQLPSFGIEDMTYEVLEGPTALFRWKMVGIGGSSVFRYSTVIDVHFADDDKMIWVGSGGWGQAGCTRASILREIENDDYDDHDDNGEDE